jgi:hypothetical protein
VLHRIGHVRLLAVDPSDAKAFVEQAPRRTHERMAGEVFLVARLLAHDEDARARIAFTENGLGGPRVEGAVATSGRLRPQALDLRTRAA